MSEIIKPDIINRQTTVINLGKIENKLVTLNDRIIRKSKRSNDGVISGYWLNIDGELYYFKVPSYTRGFINELLGEKISLHFGLPTVNNKIASGSITWEKHEQKIYGLISKWARKPGYEYQTLCDVVYGKESPIKPNSFDTEDLSILSCIDKVYPNQPINEQIRKFIIRDFFTQEYDRLEGEILLATKDNITELGYLLDYEYEWGKDFRSIYIFLKYLRLDPNNEKVISQLHNDYYFQKALQQAMDMDVVTMLKEIQEEFKIKLIDYDINLYQYKQQQMKNYIKSKKMII